MKKKLAHAFRDIRVIAASVLASTLLLSGTMINANLAAATPGSRALGPNRVFTGEYTVGGGVSSLDVDDIKLRPMLYPIKGFGRYQVIRPGGPFTAECPAVGKVVPKGFICVYERLHLGTGNIEVADPTSSGYGTTKNRMFIIQWGSASGHAWSYGSWAIRTGDASTARTTSGARTGR